MDKKITLTLGGLITLVLSFFVGYLIGRSTVELPKPVKITEVKYIKGDVVRDTVDLPVPFKVEVPVDRPVPIPTDTAKLFAVWQEYYNKKTYDLDFSNDTLGVFKVQAVVSENKLASATSTIIPYIRLVKEKELIYKVPTAQIFGIIGSSLDLRTNKIQIGVDIKQKYIIGASGIRLDDKYGYTVDFGVKF